MSKASDSNPETSKQIDIHLHYFSHSISGLHAICRTYILYSSECFRNFLEQPCRCALRTDQAMLSTLCVAYIVL